MADAHLKSHAETLQNVSLLISNLPTMPEESADASALLSDNFDAGHDFMPEDAFSDYVGARGTIAAEQATFDQRASFTCCRSRLRWAS